MASDLGVTLNVLMCGSQYAVKVWTKQLTDEALAGHQKNFELTGRVMAEQDILQQFILAKTAFFDSKNDTHGWTEARAWQDYAYALGFDYPKGKLERMSVRGVIDAACERRQQADERWPILFISSLAVVVELAAHRVLYAERMVNASEGGVRITWEAMRRRYLDMLRQFGYDDIDVAIMEHRRIMYVNG